MQKPSKLKDSLNKLSVEIKKLLDEIGYFDKINISQKSLYEISNLLKEHLFQTKIKKNINICFNFLF